MNGANTKSSEHDKYHAYVTLSAPLACYCLFRAAWLASAPANDSFNPNAVINKFKKQLVLCALR